MYNKKTDKEVSELTKIILSKHKLYIEQHVNEQKEQKEQKEQVSENRYVPKKGFKAIYKSVMKYNDALKNMYQRDIVNLTHKQKLMKERYATEQNWITQIKSYVYSS